MAIYRVTIMGNVWGFAHQNVLHFSKDSAVPNEPELLAAELQTGWCTLMRVSFSGDLGFTGAQVQQITTPLPVSYVTNWARISGSLPTNGQANQVALLIKLSTLLAGRSHLGRIYVSGLQSGNLLNGRFQTSAVTNYNGMIANLKARYLASGANFTGYQLGVFSRKKFALNGDVNGAFTPVVQMSISDIPATQRRRRFGVGI